MRKIKKGDEVIAIAGKNRGQRGQVTQVIDHERVRVDGMNIVKKHVKANPQAGVEGGIVDREAPLHISNVAIYNPMTKKADRVGFKFIEEADQQRKVRIFKSNQEQIDS